MNCTKLIEPHFDCVLEQRVAFLQRSRKCDPYVSIFSTSKQHSETQLSSPF